MRETQEELVLRLIDLLQKKNLTLGLAESCTGGLLSSWVTRMPGVSRCFMGCIVSYSNAVKQEVLQVSRTTLQIQGAVSADTAIEMLRGVQNTLKVDVAVALTGVAGPTGGSAEKPVGLVFVAVGGPGFERVERLQIKGDRVQIQTQSCETALRLLCAELERGTPDHLASGS